jgi:beta-galactosidase
MNLVGPAPGGSGDWLVAVRNKYAFLNLDRFDVCWALTEDGRPVRQGSAQPVGAAPGETRTARISAGAIQPKPGAEYFLRVSFHLRSSEIHAPAGHEVAWEQFRLPVRSPAPAPIPASNLPEISVRESRDAVALAGTRFELSFSRLSGTLSQLAYSGRELLCGEGPRLNVFRAFTDNDKWFAGSFMASGLHQLAYRPQALDVRRLSQSTVQIVSRIDCAGSKGSGFRHEAVYTVFGNGVIAAENLIEPYGMGQDPLPRLGVRMRLDPAFDRLEWFGRGPSESYADRKTSADVGRYAGRVAHQYVLYARPQENGSKEDVRWAALTDGSGAGLLIVADPLMAFSAHHFTAEDLHAARHIHELRRVPEVVVCLDYAQMGLGGASCGPPPMRKYQLRAQPVTFRFTLQPCAGDPADLARQPLGS